MRKFLTFLFLLFSILSVAQDLPEKSSRLVNDFSNTLSAEERNSLEQKLVSYNDSTSTQLAVILVPSLGGYEVSDYAVRLAEKWGIGTKDKDNGVLMLICIPEKKVTIQTGYGMEGVLPDAICKRIIENEIKPSFQQGAYYQGIDLATTAIFKFAAGEYKADHYGKAGKGQKIPFKLIILLFILFVIFLSRGNKRKYQNIGSGGTSGLPFWMLMGGMGSGGSHRGSWGGFSGGSGGGGGFGGFGGGSFGGGGASGSW